MYLDFSNLQFLHHYHQVVFQTNILIQEDQLKIAINNPINNHIHQVYNSLSNKHIIKLINQTILNKEELDILNRIIVKLLILMNNWTGMHIICTQIIQTIIYHKSSNQQLEYNKIEIQIIIIQIHHRFTIQNPINNLNKEIILTLYLCNLLLTIINNHNNHNQFLKCNLK
jgi:hypothetical protein